MTQVLDEPWGRFHLDFPNDERFLSMPERDEIRGKAYLVLLAMAGRSVLDRSDGEISQAMFADLCKRLWPETPAGLLWNALIARRVGLVRRTSRGLRLVQQAKWQRTKAEILSAMESGRRGASKRWGSRRGTHGVPIGQPQVGDPIAEREREREKKESKKRGEKIEEISGEISPSAQTEDLVLIAPVSRTPIEQVFDAWKAATTEQHPRTKLDDKRRRVCRARLKEGWSVDELVLVVTDGWRNDPWNERPLHNEFERLLGDSATVEKFLGYATKGAPIMNARKSSLELSIEGDLRRAAQLREEGL